MMLLRTAFGSVFGCTMAIAVAGLYTLCGPQVLDRNFAIGLLLIIPVWIGSLVFTLAGDSAWRACAWLGGANALCYLILWFIHHNSSIH